MSSEGKYQQHHSEFDHNLHRHRTGGLAGHRFRRQGVHDGLHAMMLIVLNRRPLSEQALGPLITITVLFLMALSLFLP
jgi:hypothetical protein